MKEQAVEHIVIAIANLTMPDTSPEMRQRHLEILSDNLKKLNHDTQKLKS